MTLSMTTLDTPALIVDLDIMEANIARIVAACRAQRRRVAAAHRRRKDA